MVLLCIVAGVLCGAPLCPLVSLPFVVLWRPFGVLFGLLLMFSLVIIFVKKRPGPGIVEKSGLFCRNWRGMIWMVCGGYGPKMGLLPLTELWGYFDHGK